MLYVFDIFLFEFHDFIDRHVWFPPYTIENWKLKIESWKLKVENWQLFAGVQQATQVIELTLN